MHIHAFEHVCIANQEWILWLLRLLRLLNNYIVLQDLHTKLGMHLELVLLACMKGDLDLLANLHLLQLLQVYMLHYLRLAIVLDVDLMELLTSIIWQLLDVDLMDLLTSIIWLLLDVNLLSMDLRLRLVRLILLLLMNLIENLLVMLMMYLQMMLVKLLCIHRLLRHLNLLVEQLLSRLKFFLLLFFLLLLLNLFYLCTRSGILFFDDV